MFRSFAGYTKSKSLDPIKNSREMHEARKLFVCEWIRRWRYSTPRILQDLLEIQQSACSRFLVQLEKEGLIISINTGHLIHRKLIFLTAKGARLLKKELPDQLFSKRATEKNTRLDNCTHDLYCQHIGVNPVHNGFKIITEPENNSILTLRLRRPDLLLLNEAEDYITAVEFEASLKNPEAMKKMISGLAIDMEENRVHQVLFICNPKKPEIEAAITRLLNDNYLPRFHRHNDTGKLVQSNNKLISSDPIKANLEFRTLEELDAIYYPFHKAKELNPKKPPRIPKKILLEFEEAKAELRIASEKVKALKAVMDAYKKV
jgi:DNA-binding MarR family transcriptional regulator